MTVATCPIYSSHRPKGDYRDFGGIRFLSECRFRADVQTHANPGAALVGSNLRIDPSVLPQACMGSPQYLEGRPFKTMRFKFRREVPTPEILQTNRRIGVFRCKYRPSSWRRIKARRNTSSTHFPILVSIPKSCRRSFLPQLDMHLTVALPDPTMTPRAHSKKLNKGASI
jgi:hypothetical protein